MQNRSFRLAKCPLPDLTPVIAGALMLLGMVAAATLPAVAAPAIAMIGEPALPAGFDHLPYANPDAPKGGKITYGVVGSFDSLNPYIVQGGSTSARGLGDPLYGNLVFESLMARNADEPFTLYGLIAQSIETPPDRSWVTFTLNPKAHFSDGQPITPEDVVFSMELLRDKGRPNYAAYFGKVKKAEAIGTDQVRFDLTGANDRELPLILALMPILPKHAINPDTFDKSTLKPMVGSGPYTVAEIDAPSAIIYRRDPNYWGKDLPINRGLFNFDEIRFDYYRDANTLFEAFKKGLFDIQLEGDPGQWNSGYDFPAARDGRVARETFKTATPKGMTGFAFNTRRAIFADVRVRKALASLLDFTWINKNLYYGAFSRASGYFDGSELSSIGRPADDREKALLAPFPDSVTPEAMAGTYRAVDADVAAGDRAVLKAALDQLASAGYELRGNALVNKASGAPFSFEIMTGTREDEKIALAYQRTLARIGIATTVRTVDSTEFDRRRRMFDYDMVRASWSASLSPGNEQLNRWSSASADGQGSFNYAGAHSPALDALIKAILSAPTREDFVAAVRAYDRVLISGYYVVPFFYLPDVWVAHWSRIEHPATAPLTGYALPTWWAKAGG
jgi:peptide/nickel transport system substrate-binding protein